MDQKFDFLKFDLAGTATFCCLICWQNSAWFDMENILAISCVLLLSTWISVEFLFLKDLSGKKKKKKKKKNIPTIIPIPISTRNFSLKVDWKMKMKLP